MNLTFVPLSFCKKIEKFRETSFTPYYFGALSKDFATPLNPVNLHRFSIQYHG